MLINCLFDIGSLEYPGRYPKETGPKQTVYAMEGSQIQPTQVVHPGGSRSRPLHKVSHQAPRVGGIRNVHRHRRVQGTIN